MATKRVRQNHGLAFKGPFDGLGNELSNPTTTSVRGRRILRTKQEMNIEDSLKRVPTYTEVVAAYKLDILKPGDDLQIHSER
jgi:hypothetical protein